MSVGNTDEIEAVRALREERDRLRSKLDNVTAEHGRVLIAHKMLKDKHGALLKAQQQKRMQLLACKRKLVLLTRISRHNREASDLFDREHRLDLSAHDARQWIESAVERLVVTDIPAIDDLRARLEAAHGETKSWIGIAAKIEEDLIEARRRILALEQSVMSWQDGHARLVADKMAQRDRRIAELEAALQKIAPSQRGLDMNADDAEQADYWSRLCFHYRNIATVALAAPASPRQNVSTSAEVNASCPASPATATKDGDQ